MRKVVKVSGGRSSALMLRLILPELDAKNGDLIVFNNTSAEHSATYEFLKRLTDEAHAAAVPFFWLEFATYEAEDANGDFYRKPGFKLVNQRPYHRKNPHGYRSGGEVFEEMLSHLAAVPNQHTRFCTTHLKIFTTNAFIDNYFHTMNTGRSGDEQFNNRIDKAMVMRRHKKYGGSVPSELLMKKKAYVLNCAPFLPDQNHAEYSDHIGGTMPGCGSLHIAGNKEPPKWTPPSIYGENATSYTSFIGLRADEMRRLAKMKERAATASTNTSSFFNQPPGEHIRAPLIEKGIDRAQVNQYWDGRDDDLIIPSTYSNCVYCFLKGKKQLAALANAPQGRENTPEHIDWWIAMEKKYSKDMLAEGKTVKSNNRFITLFGASPELIYPIIKKSPPPDNTEQDQLSLPCHCTD